MLVYFGGYTEDGAEGIFRAELDMRSGELTMLGGVGGVTNPSFLVLNSAGKHLYAVSEGGMKHAGAAAFAIEPATGDLTLINTQPSGGGGACHIALDPTGSTAIVSNYGGGSVASFPIQADGSLGPIASFVQHADPSNKKSPHAHSTRVDATGRFALTADLGLDQVIVYRFDADTSGLTRHEGATLDLPSGVGPRHLTFHPDIPWAYLINEHGGTVTVLHWDPSAGTLAERQTIGTLPDDYHGRNATAEVVVHPNGRFLYGSNRGHDSLVIYSINQETGLLSLVGFQPTGGKDPRNFNIDPTGAFLIACNQNSGHAQVFRVDQASGQLTAVGEPFAVPTATCVKFLPR